MSALNILYGQTITLFNRIPGRNGTPTVWIPTVIDGVHLVVGQSSNWSSHGGKTADTASLNIPFTWHGDDSLVSCRSPFDDSVVVSKKWYQPKEWRRMMEPENGITFAFGENDDFDFFIEGAFDEFVSPIPDDKFERKGFFNYMNKTYDNVFAITSVQRFSLIPHFELTAR